MHRLLMFFAFVLLALGVGLYLYAGWGVARNIYQAIAAKPYPQPYKATVVGFEKRYGRHTSTVPIVEVLRSGESAFRFTSSRSSIIQTLAVRESVQLVLVPTKNALGEPDERLEIADAYHLWLGDLLAWLLYPTILGVVVFYVRLFPPRRPGSYVLPR